MQRKKKQNIVHVAAFSTSIFFMDKMLHYNVICLSESEFVAIVLRGILLCCVAFQYSNVFFMHSCLEACHRKKWECHVQAAHVVGQLRLVFLEIARRIVYYINREEDCLLY